MCCDVASGEDEAIVVVRSRLEAYAACRVTARCGREWEDGLGVSVRECLHRRGGVSHVRETVSE